MTLTNGIETNDIVTNDIVTNEIVTTEIVTNEIVTSCNVTNTKGPNFLGTYSYNGTNGIVTNVRRPNVVEPELPTFML